MSGRRLLSHQTPDWVDLSSEAWFVTICCQERGRNQLARPGIGEAILESVAYRYELRHWYPHLFLLMPDHCHGLITFPGGQSPAKVVRDWKHWIATQHGIVWQVDFFDHRVRGDEEFQLKADYILQNPVRAGLVDDTGKWPLVWRVGDSESGRCE